MLKTSSHITQHSFEQNMICTEGDLEGEVDGDAVDGDSDGDF